MLIVNFRAGQLANKLFHFGHFIANCKAHGYKLYYPFFAEYKPFFENLESDEHIRVSLFANPVLASVSLRIVRSLERKSKRNVWVPAAFMFHDVTSYEEKDVDYDMNEADFVAAAKEKIVVANGWLYRDHKNFKIYADEIRRTFRPKVQFVEEAANVLAALKTTTGVVIGVHIRRGDYRQYDRGKWFYDDSVYRNYMQSLASIFGPEGKECIFLIASNEKVNKANFSGLNVHCEERHFITDLMCLSMCDYIMGPPSTFSKWASFYSRVPLYQMYEKDQNMAMEDFGIIEC